jgi:hypothetical protein
MVRLLAHFFFACTLAALARAFSILNGDVEGRGGTMAQRNVPWNSTAFTGWVVI